MQRLFFQLVLGVLLLSVVSGCEQQNPVELIHLSGATMGTTWSVSLLPAPGGTDPAALKTQLQQRLVQINGLMSTYDPDSEISRFNRQTGSDWFAISAETAQVIELSLQISQLTNGAFDISVGPLVELWGFGALKRGKQIPTDDQVREQLAQVGFKNLQLRLTPAAIKKQLPQLRIDLSAVAKGYAVDALKEILVQQGVSNFLLEIGGELQIAGQRGDGMPWRIAIEKPLEGTREVETVFPLTETAVATSGNYRNYYIENGQRYVHTIDPQSGRPIRHKLASVTVLDPNCARADALATALMVMGEEQGRQFCEKNQLAAYLLIHDKETTVDYASPAFQAFVKKVTQ
jgi:thiamine biosynthesis lipoprotein